ncbi:hypothetical protein XaplCFBP3123_17110 [Xanthomonas arboricola pv. populi]|nr:hypothetical protein XaplCFBP3123_17110 [Xanthomonas arboricola pv. populi]
MLGVLMVCTVVPWHTADAQEGEDPAMTAALAQCPDAAQFVRTQQAARARAAAAQSATNATPSALELRAHLLAMERADQQVRGRHKKTKGPQNAGLSV